MMTSWSWRLSKYLPWSFNLIDFSWLVESMSELLANSLVVWVFWRKRSERDCSKLSCNVYDIDAIVLDESTFYAF